MNAARLVLDLLLFVLATLNPHFSSLFYIDAWNGVMEPLSLQVNRCSVFLLTERWRDLDHHDEAAE